MKYILDMDTGIDDALALAYACTTMHSQIAGITCVFGNTNVKQAYANTCHILHVLKEQHRVFKGVEYAMHVDAYTQKAGGVLFHGKHGLANIQAPQVKIEEKDAVSFIIEQAEIYGNELCIIATGAFSNLAKAILKAPTIMQTVRVIVMGGAFACLGNITRFAEANVFQDPVAANLLFQSGIQITMVGLDVTTRFGITETDISHWKHKNEVTQCFYNLFSYYKEAHQNMHSQFKQCPLHDPLAVIAATHPTCIKTFPCCIQVIEQGEEQGRIILDSASMDVRKPNVHVALDVDVAYAKHAFLSAMNTL